MAQIHMRGADIENSAGASTAPLVALFERDDSLAVPLLSQMRMAGYDVRAARTPVELFDLLGKNFVSLVLVDLGNATAGRREFWVALDAQRRGRALQVMTFRYISPVSAYDLEFETSARAIADVEIHSVHEFVRVVDAVRQRIPLNGAVPGTGVGIAPGAPIPPLGAALGAPAPFSMPLGGPQFGRMSPGAPGANPFTYPPQPAQSAFPSPWSVPPQPPLQPLGAQGGWGTPASDPFTPNGGYNPYGGLSPLYESPLSPLPNPGSSTAQITPAWASSPFASPAGVNPFAAEVEESPFDHPNDVNPFAAEPAPAAPSSAPAFGAANAPGASPFAAPFAAPAAAPAAAPWGGSSSQPAAPQRPQSQQSYGGYGSASAASYPGGFGASGYGSPQDDAIQDAWIPPDDELDGQTGMVPEVAFSAPSFPSYPSQPSARAPQAAPRAASAPAPASERRADYGQSYDRGYDQAPSQDYDDDYGADDFYRPRQHNPSVSRQATAAQVPAIRMPVNEAEEALGQVLVEGALLTPNKLDALKGIQQMLAGVNMHVKLGELALRFKFLSPDQLLAALLVSRGLVSPQQIAALGRVKQELAVTGMDHDLETLLVMFNVLPAEQLRELRAELV